MSGLNSPANPYQPPVGVEETRRGNHYAAIGSFCFWLAVLCFAIGILSMAFRNMPPLGWLLVASGLMLVAGILCRNRYRTLAMIGLLVCVSATVIATITHYHYLQALKARQRALQAAEAAAYAAEYQRAMLRRNDSSSRMGDSS